MLRRLIEDGKPDYFAVVFDAPGKTFRDDLYPEYKANRSPMPDALAAQIAPLHELIRVHGWPILMIEGVEADDVIGTLARQAEQLDIDTLISTGDKDLAQLITPRVTLVNTMSNEILDMTTVVDKFAVRADQLLDYLALIGDSIDNIPGVPKVGPKTAARWLAEHGTLDNVMANAGSIGGAVGENLRAALTWLPQGKRLLTVKTDCTLPFAPHELVIQPHDADKLRELYERFEFRSWLKDSAQNNAEVPPVTVTQDKDVEPEVVRQPIAREYEAVLDDAAFERMIDEMQGAELVSFDTETTGLDPMEAQIVGLSFSFEPGRAWYIPLTHRYAGVPSQLAAVRRMQATMSLVEGYGNLVMNLVGRRLLPGFDQLEAAYRRRSRRRSALEMLLWRLTGLELKLQQYRLGEAFSRAIHDRYGMAVLNRAWESPSTLPGPEELRDPDRWYRRVVEGKAPGGQPAPAPA